LLLDKYLNWPAYQKATPSFIEPLTKLASQVPFRQMVETVKKLVAGVVSRSTIHETLQEIAGNVTEAEKAQWEACFQKWVLSEPGKRKVGILFKVEMENETIIMSVTATSEKGVCPHCQEVSESIHSYYQRHPADMPIAGHRVRLDMTIPRFFCDNERSTTLMELMNAQYILDNGSVQGILTY